MKIVVLGLRGIPDVQGGIETHCEQLYPRLVRAGHEVIIYARCDFVHQHEPYEFKGCRVIPLKHFRRSTLEAGFHTLLGLFHALMQRPDILHLHAIGPALFAPLARIMGMKVVMTHHGMDYKRKKWGSCARGLLHVGEVFGVCGAHKVIAISQGIARHVERVWGGKTAALIPNGVTLPSIVGEQPISPEFASLGLSGKRYIFALGRFVPEKGFDKLIEAWKMLPSGTCELVLAGDADNASAYCETLKRQARDAGVILTGFVKGPQLHDLFRFAHTYVIPSTHEGLPIALLEAMSYNLRIIASDIEPHLEMKLPTDCYFPSENVEEMARSLQQSMTTGRSSEFRTIVAHKYNWDIIASQTEKVYCEVTGLDASGVCANGPVTTGRMLHGA